MTLWRLRNRYCPIVYNILFILKDVHFLRATTFPPSSTCKQHKTSDLFRFTLSILLCTRHPYSLYTTDHNMYKLYKNMYTSSQTLKHPVCLKHQTPSQPSGTYQTNRDYFWKQQPSSIIINEIFVMRLSKTNAAKAHCSWLHRLKKFSFE